MNANLFEFMDLFRRNGATPIPNNFMEVYEKIKDLRPDTTPNPQILREALEDMMIEKTYSGETVTIPAILNEDLESLNVTLSPSQDLNGYDKPWAGGAGKNKIGSTLTYIKSANASGIWSGNDYTINGLTFSVLVDSSNNVTGIKVTGTASERTDFRVGVPDLVTGTDYILNGCPADGSDSTYRLTCLYGASSSAHDRGSGSATFTAAGYEGTHCYIRIANGYAIATDGLTYYPMVRLATEADATFEPYTNICPITGTDSLSLTRAGKNKLPLELDTIKSLNTDGTWSGNTYTLSGITLTIQTDNGGNVTGIKANGTSNRDVFVDIAPETSFNGSYILNGCPSGGGANKYELAIYNAGLNAFIARDFGGGSVSVSINEATRTRLVIRNGQNINNLVFLPMIRLSTETDATFEPYNGQTYTVTLPSTVYGGNIDVVEGNSEETWDYIASYNAEVLPGVWLSDRDEYAEGTTPTTGAEVCYELETPTTLSTTPTTITLNPGKNVITASSGVIDTNYQTLK